MAGSGPEPIRSALVAVRLIRPNLCFNLPDSLVKTALNLLHGRTLAQVPGLVEVLEISSQFQQELLG